MNERILELAKQAGLKFPSETAMSPVELKFAQLIVKECVEVMNTTVKQAEENNTYMGDDVPTRVHQYTIKHHFGVEY
jgi:hypothetical protein